MENSQYGTWAEAFKIHARSHNVLLHILPPTTDMVITPPTTAEEKELWDAVDATVLQWIYMTISLDLLKTIIEPDATAMEAWNRLKDIFPDSETSRAITLGQEFATTRMEDFPIATASYQRLQNLVDQLQDVGAPGDDHCLVSGLTEAYKGVETHICHANPLPKFSQARSSLCLEERELQAMASSSSSGAALITSTQDMHYVNSAQPSPPGQGNKSNKQRKNNSGAGNQRHGAQNRASGTQQRAAAQASMHQQAPQPGHWLCVPAGAHCAAPGWAPPPSPYPTVPCQGAPRPLLAAPYARQTRGILGSHPYSQAYMALMFPPGSYAMTVIESVMHPMSLQQPDPTWYMDTLATLHMTSTKVSDPLPTGSPNPVPHPDSDPSPQHVPFPVHPAPDLHLRSGDGKTQQVGIDCGEIFSPVVKPATIRTVLGLAFLALSQHWPIHQLVFFEDYRDSLNIFPPPVSTAGEY